MESLSILAIVITGFLYVNLSLTTRYKFKRSADWSAYLYVAGWGICFFFMAWCIISSLSILGLLRELYNYLFMEINFNRIVMTSSNLEEKKNLLKLIAICVLSIGLAFIIGWCNRIYYKLSINGKLRVLSKLIGNNPFESLVFESHIRAFPVLVTLSSNKVYVGIIPSAPLLEDGRLEYISLLPLLSGYRESDILGVTFTTNYYDHYDEFLSDDEQSLSLNDFNITFPISQILSISLFNMETYKKFQSKRKLYPTKRYFSKSTSTRI